MSPEIGRLPENEELFVLVIMRCLLSFLNFPFRFATSME